MWAKSVRRKEDNRLLTGGGRYLDDVTFEGQSYAYFVRSPHAHANDQWDRLGGGRRCTRRDWHLSPRKDLEADELGGIPCLAVLTSRDGSKMAQPPHNLLASDRVRTVGDAVAVVVAETAKQAKDAADLVMVDYDILPSVTDTRGAFKSKATIWDDAPNNQVFDWENGDREAVDAAFAKAAHVTKIDLINNRVVVASMEPRGALGPVRQKTGRYTLHTPCQTRSHDARHRVRVARAEADQVRVVSPDVGGGFGMKVFVYPEQCYAVARQENRPSGEMDERTHRGLRHRHARSGPRHPRGIGDGQGRQVFALRRLKTFPRWAPTSPTLRRWSRPWRARDY